MKFLGLEAELKKLNKYPLTVAQSERITALTVDLESQLYFKPETRSVLSRCTRITINKLSDSLDLAQSQTEDLEALKTLQRKITTSIQRKNPILVAGILEKIKSKISHITEEKVLDGLRNNIPDNISAIIKKLANGTIDIDEAKAIIEEEAKRKVAGRPKTMFSLTQEQEKKQFMFQIKTALSEKGYIYRIKDPEEAISSIQKLTDTNFEDSLRVVVANLISTKDFEVAKGLVDKYYIRARDSKYKQNVFRFIRNDIRNAEISDMILRGINAVGTPEEEDAYFALIKKGIKDSNISPQSISLGRSEDGLRTITLADIWGENIDKEKT